MEWFLGPPVMFRGSGVVTPVALYGATVSLSCARLRRLRKRKHTTPSTTSATPAAVPPMMAPRLGLEVLLLKRGERVKSDTRRVNTPRI